MTSSDVGMVFRGDITRIGGTYWNLSGYWRGRLTKNSAASQQTLQDLINRTYHLNMTYDNPNSTPGRGVRTPVSALGAQPRHHRWRILRKQALQGNDAGNLWRIDARSVFLGLQPEPGHRRRVHQL